MSPDCPLSFYWDPREEAVFSRAATQSLCSTATHSHGQEEVERQELQPCDSVTAADTVELDALVVIDVKPAILSNSEQCLRMQKPGRRGGEGQWERGSRGSHSIGRGCLTPTDRISRTASMTLISHMSLFVTQSRVAT